MSCHETVKVKDSNHERKVLLVGNPNVGKSVIFSRLTGVQVESANYPGTTVDVSSGEFTWNNKKAVLIDVPGVYSLEANSVAEEVAINILEEGADLIIYVLDATNLGRNLDLALQLAKYQIPVVYALNLVDIAEMQGIVIDTKRLSELLMAPVIPTVATQNKGLKELAEVSFTDNNQELAATSQRAPVSSEMRWKKIDQIIKEVEKEGSKQESFLQRLGEWTIQPMPGWPIAIFVLLLSLGIVVGGGKGLRALILLPLVNNIIVPFITTVVSAIVPEGIFLNLLVGEYGVLIKSIEWPFALVLPYVFLFYIVFSILEDSGYLPRLAVMADATLKRLGIQGGSIIPLMLGYGCAVPAILGTRTATTKKERMIVTALVSFAIPCASQSAAFFALLGDHSLLVLVLMYLISFLALAGVGAILNRVIPGQTQPLLIEIPNLLPPDWSTLTKKLKMRMKHFLVEAEIPMFLGILLAAVVVETGLFNQVSIWIEPMVSGWLGLPPESSLSLLLGIIRRELAVLPLLELNLSTLQLLVGATLALFYLPCISVFAVLAKEFSLKFALGIGASTIAAAFLFAGIINHVGSFLLLLVG